MLLATVWRHAAIYELYRDETSQCWSRDASTDEAYPPRARSGGFRMVVCAPITVGLSALTSARNGPASVPVVGPRHYRVGRVARVNGGLGVLSHSTRSGHRTIRSTTHAHWRQPTRLAPMRPWSLPWSLSERISDHLRTSQSRSHAAHHLRAPRLAPSSPVSPIACGPLFTGPFPEEVGQP
jgi:hypothetical protein